MQGNKQFQTSMKISTEQLKICNKHSWSTTYELMKLSIRGLMKSGSMLRQQHVLWTWSIQVQVFLHVINTVDVFIWRVFNEALSDGESGQFADDVQ